MSFIDELKRRKVTRVAASYAVVAWILMQIGEVTFPALNIPDWVMSTLVVILLAGFPIAVIFAWVFDKTPQGYIKTDAVSEGESTSPPTDSRPFYLQKKNIFLVLGVVAGVLIGSFGGSALSESTVDDKSIAVLPFDNYSTAPEDQYFSDGVTEVITANLAKIGGLKVISRTSVMEYKNTTKKVKEIAEELGVAHILEGSIQRIGDNIRIVGQLINTKTDEHIWAETYDGKIDDIFMMQTDVALKISEALKTEISDKAATLIKHVPTESIEAYDYYLKGLAQYNYYLIDSTKKSIETYRKALKIDPNYALAHAGICNSYGWMEILTGVTDYLSLGESECRKAISINNNLPEAWKGLGNLEHRRGNYVNALSNFEKAVIIDPNYELAQSNILLVNVHLGNLALGYNGLMESLNLNSNVRPLMVRWIFQFHSALGAGNEAEEIILNQLKMNPSSIQMRYTLSELYFDMGQKEKHKRQVDLLTLSAPNHQFTYKQNMIKSFNSENYRDALKWHEKIENPNELDIIKLFCLKQLGEVQQYDRFKKELYNYFNYLYEEKIIDHPDLVSFIIINAIDGNKKKSMQLLNEAVNNGFRNYSIFENWPHAAEIRTYDEYKAIKERMIKLVNIERDKLGWDAL